jgi:hypothetical protein
MRLKLKFGDLNSKESIPKPHLKENSDSKSIAKSIYYDKNLIKRFNLSLKDIKNIFGYPISVYSWSAKDSSSTFVCHFGFCHMIFDRKIDLDSHLKTHLD